MESQRGGRHGACKAVHTGSIPVGAFSRKPNRGLRRESVFPVVSPTGGPSRAYEAGDSRSVARSPASDPPLPAGDSSSGANTMPKIAKPIRPAKKHGNSAYHWKPCSTSLNVR